MTTKSLDLDLNSDNGGSIHLTIVSNVSRSTSQECREAMVRPVLTNAGTVRCLFTKATTTYCTSVTGMEMTNAIVVYPVTDTNQLSFWGTNGDEVDIQWRT